MYCVKAVIAVYAVTSEMKNKEYHHHGGFQQQSSQCLVDRNEHIDIRNDHYHFRLKPKPLEYCLIR